MSKYVYTTVYEEFTGIKPPEPKEHKPKKKRSYGHPYRMRLNMQNHDSPSNEKPPLPFNEEYPSFNDNDYPDNLGNYLVKPEGTPREDSEPCMSEASPRVTYKKRRHVDHDVCPCGTHI
ncbi:MAG: hypothetical protein KAG53_12265 [Endozoicomonadaceae bacterium]|nr:hypothetical protein [Endozoicomonadaceae bacterium]